MSLVKVIPYHILIEFDITMMKTFDFIIDMQRHDKKSFVFLKNRVLVLEVHQQIAKALSVWYKISGKIFVDLL